MLNTRAGFRQFYMTRAAHGLLGIALLLLAACSERMPPPVAEANGEKLEGLWEGEGKQIATFRGVPFAAPPLGDLRWRAPIPNAPRIGRQEATEFAPACLQAIGGNDSHARIAAAFGRGQDGKTGPNGVGEDCLYLNIWSPDLDPGAGLPVLVWVHGGGNAAGWSYEPGFIGDRLAARGVVVVSVAYRLGPFGFFSHPALDNGEGAPLANFGLLDIRQAFRWVRLNIRSFGGDPENITGFGQASGAGNLLDWAVAGGDEEGLFRRMIVQSSRGSLAQRRSLADEQSLGERLVGELDLGNGVTARHLREVPAQEILDAAGSVLVGHYFDAVLDGLTMVRQPIEALQLERLANLELLTGSNSDEWYMELDPATTGEDVIRWIKAEAPEFAGSLQAAVADETDPRRALDRLKSARDTLCPLRKVSAAVSAQGGQAYVYYFTRVRPGTGGQASGAYNGAELPYVFGMLEDGLPSGPEDQELSNAMMDYWVQFARAGDPGIRGRPGWPTYVAGRPYEMEFGDGIGVTGIHDGALCQYLDMKRGR